MSIWTRSRPMWCTLGSTRTMTWISECRGLMTLLQPSHLLCYQGSSAVFGSLGGQRYPEGLLLPRWKRACGVPAELLGQMHQAPHASAGLHLMCEWPKWRPKGTSCMSREGLTLTKPSLGLTQRMQLLLSYQMMTRLASPLIHLRLSLHQKLNQPGARSDPLRTGVHAHLFQRSGLQKKRRRVCLLMKPFYPEGCWRKTSSPRDMKSLPRIMTGSSA